MNRSFSEMLHCLQTPGNLISGGADMTVLERQRAHLKWQHVEEEQQPPSQQQEQQLSYLSSENNNNNYFSHLLPLPSSLTSSFDTNNLGFVNNESVMRELARRAMKADPGLGNGWGEFGKFNAPAVGIGGGDENMGFRSSCSVEMSDFTLSRSASCAPAVGNGIPAVEGLSPGKMAPAVGRESSKKRKADKAQNPKGSVTEEPREKRIKGDTDGEVESRITEQKSNNNRETSADTSKETSKISEVQKPDYIHVRARRGQATDSHSLAERVRREKISERMKYLQDLVPGCNKITGKAGMLDEIINYVQSLQRQVEFLSMKLATVNPRLDFNVESFLAKDTLPVCSGGFPIEIAPEMANCSPYLQFNQVQQVASSCGLDMVINPSQMAALRRTTSAPVAAAPDAFLDTTCFTQEQQPSSTTWENDLQNLYSLEFHQGRPTEFPTQPFTGSMEANNLKMEM